ncbi:MAG: DUF2851 family protein [Lutibacter sp.]|uniref:DUF2851 family protein n=1 Tax=Lutibacter sp. TaxID=1925666 RepID=UPI00299ECFAB|nr:DUF2851 family protein [Lutibacter sp.]MDX1829129.1 DUF2851 family protein [Lutibacter sp.]
MKENLLHFIWKLKLFSSNKLITTSGKNVQIISVGTHNYNSGPDFLNAKIIINEQLWVGNVEIHILSSDWYAHSHEKDTNYDAVILHVVWGHDIDVFRNTNESIETLVLKDFMDERVLVNYKELFNSDKKWINCENEIKFVDNFTKNNWLERLYFERLEEKSELINTIFKSTNSNWEATLFILLAKNFGLKVNGESFLQFATSFDFSIVRKIGDNPFQMEALFLGRAGLLCNDKESVFYSKLKQEYEYLSHKFKLDRVNNTSMQFFRLRPANFPTIRLSQLAMLFSKQQNLFSKIIETTVLEDFYTLFSHKTTEFWETHYTFETSSKKSAKKLTKSFIHLVLINTIVPLKFAYLKTIGKLEFNELLNFICEIEPEKNSIISNFEILKFKGNNAFETQALLQLKNNYCNKKLCLQCTIGKEILKR